MKWIALKLSNIDELYNEYDQVFYNYKQLRANVKLSKTKKSVSELKMLRDDIKNRIRELNDFYNKYINDSRIGAFEIIKNKLEVLLLNKDTASNTQSLNSTLTQRKSITSVPIELKLNKNASKEKIQVNNNKNKNNYKDNYYSEDNNDDNDNDHEIFTCCNSLIASHIKTRNQWKDMFIKVKLTEAEYNILFKDDNLNSN